MSTNYRQAAAGYATREIRGTDALAFRLIAERVAATGWSGSALDIGCGAGRSTRFLAALGFEATGVDVSDAMLRQARRKDPQGVYRLSEKDRPLPFADSSFDLVSSTWVVLELVSRSSLATLLREAARVLRPGGIGFVVANTPEFYSHRWVSCEVDFAENRPPLRSGQPVKARLMPEGVVVDDTFWTDADYREALALAGLVVAGTSRPTASPEEDGWRDEARVAPWVIYEVTKRDLDSRSRAGDSTSRGTDSRSRKREW